MMNTPACVQAIRAAAILFILISWSVLPPRTAAETSWPMFMPALIGQRCEIGPLWGAYTTVCCTYGSATVFSVMLSGETKLSTKTSCTAGATWNGWEDTAAGKKSVQWKITSPTCGTGQGSFTWEMTRGKSYLYQMEFENNQLVVFVYSGDACKIAKKTTTGKTPPFPKNETGPEKGNLRQIDRIILDPPPGGFRQNCIPAP